MLLDERSELAQNLPLNTGGAGTYLLGDVIDTEVARDLDGSDMFLVIVMRTAATSGGAATGQFLLVSDAGAAIATDGSATEHARTAAIPVASLIAGHRVCAFRLPSGAYERYLGVLQVTGGAAFSGGRVDMFFVSDPALYRSYADNVA